MTTSFVGSSIQRREDDRLLRGEGTFVDDIAMDNTLHAAFVRSEAAHALITGIDVTRALEIDGVVAVLTYDDLAGTPLAAPLRVSQPHPAIRHARTPYPLARDEVHHVGQPIAMVVARDRYIAEDAAAVVHVDYQHLPVAVDLVGAARGEDGPAHSDMDGNVYASLSEHVGDVDAVLAKAEHVFEYDLRYERAAGTPLEGRGLLATFDELGGRMRLWDSTQAPMMVCHGLAPLLGLEPEQIEVISPDVGGGFGTKAFQLYPEEALVPWAARWLGAPLKWIEDRKEAFVGSNQLRSQVTHVKVAVDGEGHLLALDVRYLHDNGAFCQFGILVPSVTASELSGQYRIPNLRFSFDAVYTNTTQCSPYRGSGQPYATFVVERMMDWVARDLGIDRAEIRRRNFIPPQGMPYDTGLSFPHGNRSVYDSGQYPAQFETLLEAIGYDGFAAEKAAAAAEGRRIGLGLTCYVDVGGTGPYESTKVTVLPDGSVSVVAATSDTGQGHETMYSQLVADQLGVPMERVRVTTGDSRRTQYGFGTWGSRTAAVGGSSAVQAAATVATKAKAIAARLLEVDAGDLELADGAVRVKGAAHVAVPLTELVIPARFGRTSGGESSPGLTAASYWSPSAMIFSSGAHGVVVEIDPETYDLNILRYVIAHDCGKVINPMLVRGQVLGGFAHGIADAFYERRHYDNAGQLLNQNLMGYLVPFASEIPQVEVRHMESSSPVSIHGVKGAGEAGSVPVPTAIASAIEDALGFPIDAMPQSPLTLFELAQRHGR
ncbi:dehydrogenase [Lentzea pudingi]|uniref:Dehydrogenase n=1 Tax=Lentzea pudingi TaxID=1789439 RepID=A0ABQ2IS28_9PSEU|nr:xanthine dehydrogenase family protein molybdopterin-binding subunit [Lentzea pudingi]GGN28681.1 dehydrogenase [Lentzea pudingi]